MLQRNYYYSSADAEEFAAVHSYARKLVMLQQQHHNQLNCSNNNTGGLAASTFSSPINYNHSGSNNGSMLWCWRVFIFVYCFRNFSPCQSSSSVVTATLTNDTFPFTTTSPTARSIDLTAEVSPAPWSLAEVSPAPRLPVGGGGSKKSNAYYNADKILFNSKKKKWKSFGEIYPSSISFAHEHQNTTSKNSSSSSAIGLTPLKISARRSANLLAASLADARDQHEPPASSSSDAGVADSQSSPRQLVPVIGFMNAGAASNGFSSTSSAPPTCQPLYTGTVFETTPIGTFVVQVRATPGGNGGSLFGNQQSAVFGGGITYSIQDSTFSRFFINPQTGVITTAQLLGRQGNAGGNVVANVTARSAIEFRVRATDIFGQFCDSTVRLNIIPQISSNSFSASAAAALSASADAFPSSSSSGNTQGLFLPFNFAANNNNGFNGGQGFVGGVGVGIGDVNQPPIFSQPSYTFSIVSCQPGAFIGSVQARDPDGDSVSYSLLNSNSLFSIDPNTGQISLSATSTGGGIFVNIPAGQIMFFVLASDTRGAATQVMVFITSQCGGGGGNNNNNNNFNNNPNGIYGSNSNTFNNIIPFPQPPFGGGLPFGLSPPILPPFFPPGGGGYGINGGGIGGVGGGGTYGINVGGGFGGGLYGGGNFGGGGGFGGIGGIGGDLPPIFLQQSYTFTLFTCAPGMFVGIVNAQDANGDTIIYSIVNDNGLFAINPLTGQIATSPIFPISSLQVSSYYGGGNNGNNNIGGVYAFQVFASDQRGASSQTTVTVTTQCAQGGNNNGGGGSYGSIFNNNNNNYNGGGGAIYGGGGGSGSSSYGNNNNNNIVNGFGFTQFSYTFGDTFQQQCTPNTQLGTVNTVGGSFPINYRLVGGLSILGPVSSNDFVVDPTGGIIRVGPNSFPVGVPIDRSFTIIATDSTGRTASTNVRVLCNGNNNNGGSYSNTLYGQNNNNNNNYGGGGSVYGGGGGSSYSYSTDSGPVFSQNTYPFKPTCNTPALTTIGTVQATPTNGNSVTFNALSSDFLVVDDGNFGRIQPVSALSTTGQSFTFIVEATSTTGKKSSATVTVNVIGACGQAPVFSSASSGPFSISKSTPIGTKVGKVMAMDPDGDSSKITYKTSSSDVRIDMISGDIVTLRSFAADTLLTFTANIMATAEKGLTSSVLATFSLQDSNPNAPAIFVAPPATVALDKTKTPNPCMTTNNVAVVPPGSEIFRFQIRDTNTPSSQLNFILSDTSNFVISSINPIAGGDGKTYEIIVNSKTTLFNGNQYNLMITVVDPQNLKTSTPPVGITVNCT